ncbi:MAG: DUF167 domain-containing protein [Planctomycetales bacterium]|nr:DUF167 domain-containing protein [Planctomycetales bacterium]
MIPIQVTTAGCIIAVKALPGSRRNEVRGEQDGALKVSVTQIAEKGKANEALRQQLAKSLGLRKSQVALVGGETQSQKKFLIADIAETELAERIAALI